MNNQPIDPIEERDAEIKRIKSQLRRLLAEERVIKAVVESIVAHEIEADYKSDGFGGGSEDRKAACELTQALEDSGVSVEMDENDQEITHVQINGKHLSFHAGDWEW